MAQPVMLQPHLIAGIRGDSVNIVYLDEAAHIDNLEEFYTSTYPTISSGENTKVVITSTPNGMNLFYKLFTEAQKKRNSYVPIFYDWRAHPNRDESWYKETSSNMPKTKFDQEFNCLFLGSAGTLISGEYLASMVHLDAIIEEENIMVYQKPKKDHNYVALIDVSEGVGKDYSTIQVIDISEKPFHQVFVYRNNLISPWEFPIFIKQIATRYNDAFVVVENNTIGKIVADTLYFELDYENMLSGEVTDKNDFSGFSTKTVGLKTTKRTKSLGCSALKKLIESDFLKIVDWETITELTTFIKVKSSYEAEKGKTDDLVMPLVLFGWLSSQTFFEDMTTKNIMTMVREKQEEDEETHHSAFGFFSDGLDDDISLF